ncbi:GIY-YIG nuclease family protein [Candidatus Parcubacteria bacterium]|nr:MAG: GIY-YIG nuclease family protein [Candidatus Parcubacteria bacterium]
MYYTYVLESLKDGDNYVGFTNNLRERLAAHQKGSSFATKSRRLLHLIYLEGCLNREDAQRRERFLKSSDGRFYIKRRLREYYRSRTTGYGRISD